MTTQKLCEQEEVSVIFNPVFSLPHFYKFLLFHLLIFGAILDDTDVAPEGGEEM